MQLLRSIDETRAWCDQIRRSGKTLAFVPTMGALHEGHLSLIRLAKAQADQVVVSIFVNPTQFGPNEDFARYPRDLSSDATKCSETGADMLFAPSAETMYPPGFESEIAVGGLTEGLCGGRRPGHFNGVCTVVAKLLNIVWPDVGVFGQKDYQQFVVIRKMASDLNLPVTIVAAPIVREADGLAMSSRNAYLTAEQRQSALVLHRALASGAACVKSGVVETAALKQRVAACIADEPLLRLDYVEVLDRDTLSAAETLREGRAVIALAAYAGKTRLIDNALI